MRGVIRTLTPLGWLAACIALLLALGAVSAAWDGLWAWAPWSKVSRLERAQDRAAQAEAERDVRELELALAREQAVRVEAAHGRLADVRAATAESVTLARSAHDADTPVNLDRIERLRAHDRRLCEQSPDLCRDAAPDPS